MKLQFISDEDVAILLTHEMAYAAVERGLLAHALGAFDQPLKPYVRPGGRAGEFDHGRHIAMPAWVGADVNAVGLKWISSVPKNIERGLPRASGLVVLNDVATGVPVAVLECGTLSARRTGAVAALAWKHLGDAGDRVAIVGCGPINREVVGALNSLPTSVGEFRVFDVNLARAQDFCDALKSKTKCDLTVSATLESCLRGATTIITATTGAKAYIDPQWVRHARLLIPLSLDDFRAETLLSADKIIVDDFNQANREEKLFHQLVRTGRLTRDQIYAELGEVVAGTKAGRTGNEIIYCNFMGMAVEDISVAKAVFDQFNRN